MKPVLPAAAHLACLASLPGAGPRRLARLVEDVAPHQAWDSVIAGTPQVAAIAGSRQLAQKWSFEARQIDPGELWDGYTEAGIGVLARDSAAYPALLADDPDPPQVLFTLGDPCVVSQAGTASVAIVGTRRCSRYGLDLAYELGHMLASNGVVVVSGLALGIDAAAHKGALDAGGAPPVAVVGSGLDVAYPRQNSHLWDLVAASGLICSEAPMSAPPERWRFPARNRIIAGLAQLTVVVESHETGGSLYTAAQAMERARPVLAVPGPIRSPSSAGCNRLLADGCHPLCEVEDVLIAVGLVGITVPGTPPLVVTDDERQVLEVIGWQPRLFDVIVERSGVGVEKAAHTVEELRLKGLLVSRGPWLERTGAIVAPHRPNDLGVGHPERPRPRGES